MRLEQIFTNLLENAAKYTEPQGRIAIAARRKATGSWSGCATPASGIDPLMASRVFDLFAQAERRLDRSPAAPGSGSPWCGAWSSCTEEPSRS